MNKACYCTTKLGSEVFLDANSKVKFAELGNQAEILGIGTFLKGGVEMKCL